MKYPLFVDDMILYTNYSINFTMINEYSNIEEYKFDVQKFVAFLYANST